MLSLEREKYFVAGLKNRDEIIFNEFHRETKTLFQSYLFKQFHYLIEADADDVLQEFYIKVWQRIEQFKEDTKFIAWLRRIISNIVIDRVGRNRYYKNTTSLNALLEAGADFEAVRPLENNERLNKAVTEIKNCLGEKHLIIFSRMYENGEQAKDIAKSLKIPIGTVLSRGFYLKRRLKAKLDCL